MWSILDESAPPGYPPVLMEDSAQALLGLETIQFLIDVMKDKACPFETRMRAIDILVDIYWPVPPAPVPAPP